ncbi:hypothetical protein [Actinoplanes sp. HUAS TT8]|uniref:hypothetical protein n=1 Tax=Actinoplanes sp. HUAS TT8 TaxID=3447453 RepID=UPI003F526D2D
MERGPMALFGAIVAVGLGPALWLGAQLSDDDVPVGTPPATIREQLPAAQTDQGGFGAGSEDSTGPAIEWILPTSATPTVSRSSSPSPSAGASVAPSVAVSPSASVSVAPSESVPPSVEPSVPGVEPSTDSSPSLPPSADSEAGNGTGNGPGDEEAGQEEPSTSVP